MGLKRIMAVGVMLTVMVVLVCVFAGCSANHWGGETSGKRPGVAVQTGLFGTKAEMTSDGIGKVDEISFVKSKEGSTLTVKNLALNQTASAVVKEEPAKIKAIAELQETQVEYVKELTAGIKGIVSEVMPVLNLLAMAKFNTTSSGITMTLPNGTSLGTQKISSGTDLQSAIVAALNKTQTLQTALNRQTTTTTQPTQQE